MPKRYFTLIKFFIITKTKPAYFGWLLLNFSLAFLPGLASAQDFTINASELIKLNNQTRTNLGLKPLVENQGLTQAAKEKADDIITKDYFAHVSPSGITPWYWFERNNYNYVYAGENLALGFTDSASAHQAWLTSPGHKANIINCHYQETGLAVVIGEFEGRTTSVAVQLFGSLTDTNCQPAAVETETSVQPQTTAITTPDETPPNAPIFITDSNLITNKSQPTLLGKSEVSARVIIYLENGQQLGLTQVDTGGNFGFSFKNSLADGVYKIYARAFDQAGNASALSQTITLTIDTKAPKLDADRSFVYPDPENYLNNFKIQVKSLDPDIASVLVLTDGVSLPLDLTGQIWSGSLPQSAGKVKAVLQDKAGNTTADDLEFLAASKIQSGQTKNWQEKIKAINNFSRQISTISLLIGLGIALARLDFAKTDDEPNEMMV